jgi:hypothetical protein
MDAWGNEKRTTFVHHCVEQTSFLTMTNDSDSFVMVEAAHCSKREEKCRKGSKSKSMPVLSQNLHTLEQP